MKQKLFLSGGIVGLVILGLLWRWETRKVHLHAGFVVYENGKRVDFSLPQYMKMEKCGEGEKEDEQLEKAHLHNAVGEVVHVHRKGAKWGDLFDNIGYMLPKEDVVGYVNGERVNRIETYPIKPYDSVVIVIGKGGMVNVSERVSIEKIKEVEATQENCGA